MPAFAFQKVIVLWLILAIGHAPVPWVHSHEGIEDEHLGMHLDLCHTGAAEMELSSAWHIHLLWIGLPHHFPQNGFSVEETLPGNDFDNQYLLKFELDSVASHRRLRDRQVRGTQGWRILPSRTSPILALVASQTCGNADLRRSLRSDERLYQRYNSLLL